MAPVSRARTIAAVRSLFGFCCRMRHLPANPAAELTLPAYQQQAINLTVNPSDETIRRGPLTVRFLLTRDNSTGCIAAFELLVPAGAAAGSASAQP